MFINTTMRPKNILTEEMRQEQSALIHGPVMIILLR